MPNDNDSNTNEPDLDVTAPDIVYVTEDIKPDKSTVDTDKLIDDENN